MSPCESCGETHHSEDMLYVNDKIENWGDETYWCRYCFENHVEHQYMKHAADNMEQTTCLLT